MMPKCYLLSTLARLAEPSMPAALLRAWQRLCNGGCLQAAASSIGLAQEVSTQPIGQRSMQQESDGGWMIVSKCPSRGRSFCSSRAHVASTAPSSSCLLGIPPPPHPPHPHPPHPQPPQPPQPHPPLPHLLLLIVDCVCVCLCVRQRVRAFSSPSSSASSSSSSTVLQDDGARSRLAIGGAALSARRARCARYESQESDLWSPQMGQVELKSLGSSVKSLRKPRASPETLPRGTMHTPQRPSARTPPAVIPGAARAPRPIRALFAVNVERRLSRRSKADCTEGGGRGRVQGQGPWVKVWGQG